MADNLSPAAPLSTPPEFLEACPRFRLLVLGSPESTKEELISKIFGTDLGKKSVADAFSASHDIEQELDLHYQNSRLAIHTSLNCGTDEESTYTRACDFLRDRSLPSTAPADRVHCIWYCVASEEDRSVADLERRFFSTGLASAAPNVPIILVFTKYEEFVHQVKLEWSHDAEERGLSKLPVTHILSGLSAEKFEKSIGNKWDDVLSESIPRVRVSSGDTVDDKRSFEELAERTLASLRDRSVKFAFAAAQRNSALISTQFCADTAADYFEVDTGHARKLHGVDMRDILPNFFAKAIQLFNMHDATPLLTTPDLLSRALNTIFPATQKPLLTECLTRSSTDPGTILSNLSPHERAVLLTQALAAAVLFLHRLAATQWPHEDYLEATHTLTPRAVARVLDELRTGPEKKEVLGAVEASPLFTTCTLRKAISDLIAGAVQHAEKVGAAAQLGGIVLDDEASADRQEMSLSFVNDKGPDDVILPCGLTILPLT